MPVIDVYPRMHRWRMERRRQVVGGVDHSLSAFRLKLEEATFYSILWMPFEDSDTIRSHQDCINALNASRCRFPLNYNGIVSIKLYCYLTNCYIRYAVLTLLYFLPLCVVSLVCR